MDLTITLTNEQVAVLQAGIDNGVTEARDLASYASEWLGSMLDQEIAKIPEQKLAYIRDAAKLGDAAVLADIDATSVKARAAIEADREAKETAAAEPEPAPAEPEVVRR